jgi:hypothetical protein
MRPGKGSEALGSANLERRAEDAEQLVIAPDAYGSLRNLLTTNVPPNASGSGLTLRKYLPVYCFMQFSSRPHSKHPTRDGSCAIILANSGHTSRSERIV